MAMTTSPSGLLAVMGMWPMMRQGAPQVIMLMPRSRCFFSSGRPLASPQATTGSMRASVLSFPSTTVQRFLCSFLLLGAYSAASSTRASRARSGQSGRKCRVERRVITARTTGSSGVGTYSASGESPSQVMARTGQAAAQCMHSMQCRRAFTAAWPSENSSTPRGQARTQTPQPTHRVRSTPTRFTAGPPERRRCGRPAGRC